MIKLGITVGDINGIGPEIIVKALTGYSYHADITIYGPEKPISIIEKKLNLKLNPSIKIIEPELSSLDISIEYGKPTHISGEISYKSLELSVKHAKKGLIDAIITAPLSKEALILAGYNFLGHTEILQKAFPGKVAQMLFVSKEIKLLLLTRHIPIRLLPELITKELITENILNLVENLKTDFGILKPKLALCGFNPHSGESGTIGTEEQEIIIPAMVELLNQGIDISGPHPADSFWKQSNDFDCVIALYHDQGLIPIKLLYWESLVNVTCGLPVVRTSPSHGTAFDIASRFVASEKSMMTAISKACEIVTSRQKKSPELS